MIIVEDTYVSDRMRRYLYTSGQPIMDTPMARSIISEEGDHLLVEQQETLQSVRGEHSSLEVSQNMPALISEVEATRRIDEGERLYTMSEGRLSWILEYTHNTDLHRAIRLCKDKCAFREALAPLYPNYPFMTRTFEELIEMPFPAEMTPCVLKPAVGFLSAGVYVIRTQEDWKYALSSICAERETWAARYSDAVIGTEVFLLEGIIEGREFALDAYFDEEGTPHILNILRHDFADAHDTSDRLYVCGVSILREWLGPMTAFLQRMNTCTQMRNFPIHIEVRAEEQRDSSAAGNPFIIPIECNPLRFAGLGGTEISSFAYGFYTFDHYLNNTVPNWDKVFAEHGDDDLYCMSVLGVPEGMDPNKQFDYERFCGQFSEVLAMDVFDASTSGIYGFQFWKTSAADDHERNVMLHASLERFVRE